jgi:phenylacetic acid degradation operon negative regulatory protein
MKDLTTDSRMILLMMAAEGVEASGTVLAALWRRLSRRGRLAQQLRNLQAGGMVNDRGSGRLDARLFRLTDRGRQAVFGAVEPEKLWSRKWDGRWRMAMFDVPQSQVALRVRLRRRLRELRFGWLQNSVWLSPDPVSRLAKQLGQDGVSVESLVFMEGGPAGGETNEALVWGAWEFQKLEKAHVAYRKLLKLQPGMGRLVRRSEWTAWLKAEQRAWREILRLDPFLPEALWPQRYEGRTIWRARLEALHACGGWLADRAAAP